ncbi:MAG: histidine kinase [Muribaculaceae bacterium]|nr:histidine kinase [Muribaculaceae bacterium]
MEKFKVRHPAGLWGIAIIFYYCWFQAFYNAVRFGNMFPYDDFHDMLVGVIKNFIPILILSITNLFIIFRVSVRLGIRKKIIIDTICSLSATIIIGAAYVGVKVMLGFSPRFDFKIIDWPGTILNDIIILMGVELVYYFTMLLKSRDETEAAQRQALQYQYDALKAQINPHFLFNSLNLLYSLVSIDNEKSKVFIRELARMYRYVMAYQNKELVELSEELGFLESYVSVLEIRYNNKFKVTINGEAPQNTYVVPFSMQLLIENVTKHNVISSRFPMNVTVKIDETGVTVSNPIQLRPADSAGNIGIRYLSKLYALHGKCFHVDNDNVTFTAYVPLIKNSEI